MDKNLLVFAKDEIKDLWLKLQRAHFSVWKENIEYKKILQRVPKTQSEQLQMVDFFSLKKWYI